jgi:SHS2 domain-containing protein
VQGLAALAGAGSGEGGAEPRVVRVDGREPVERLVALLDEVVALTDVEGVAAADAAVTVSDGWAEARLDLAPIEPAAVVAPPKATTWHGAVCEPAGDGWRARVIIDR